MKIKNALNPLTQRRAKKTNTDAPPEPPKAPEIEQAPIAFLKGRFWIAYAVVLLLVGALVWRTMAIQLFGSADELREKADKNSIVSRELSYSRGRIVDRNGQLLAVSIPSFNLSISPIDYFKSLIQRDKTRWRQLAVETGDSSSRINQSVNAFVNGKHLKEGEELSFEPRALLNPKNEEYWRFLAQLTKISPEVLNEKVRNNPDSPFMQLENEHIQLEKRKLQELTKAVNRDLVEFTDKLYKQYQAKNLVVANNETETIANYADQLKISGLAVKNTIRRVYPKAEEVSQLVGLVRSEGDVEIGSDGIELRFQDLLVGNNGQRLTRRNKKGERIEEISRKDAYTPQDIELSIDGELQSMAYEALKKAVVANKAESATAVMVDVQTGEILVMANAPSYNPNNRATLNKDKQELMRNRAVTDTFEPGSTVKPFTVLTALNNRVTHLDEIIDTKPFYADDLLVRDTVNYPSLSLTGILQKSSNVGVARLALRMPATALVETYSKLGFGESTKLNLGESRGTNGKRNRFAMSERATMSYGYALSVTPLQLAHAYATLGSYGIRRPLSITKVTPPITGNIILPQKLTKQVVEMLESVAQKGGTGTRAAIDGYRVAVKTGTAKMTKNGRYTDNYLAFTAGIAPASNPRYALVVLVSNLSKAGEYYGGTVAAPLFSQIMGYTLKMKNIKPDNLPSESTAAAQSNAH